MVADTPSTVLKLRDQGPGNNPTTWGEITDVNLSILEANTAATIEIVVAGSADITLTDANYTLDQGKYGILKLTGVLTGNISLIIPASSRKLLIWNASTGNFTITVKTSGGSGVIAPRNTHAWFHCDGTNTYIAGGTTDYLGGDIPQTQDTDYVFFYMLPYSATITQTSTQCDSGTATATMKINTTALGGAAHSVSSNIQTIDRTTNNTFVFGDKFQITVSNSALCVNFRFNARFERTTY